ncbi:MAG TPA: hypothetical protein VG735_14225 [Caulobacterales bacterium]|nr:hypothetical protein [Caulobacterales bacterium]
MRAGATLLSSFLALLFNAALLALPFTVLGAWTAYRDGDVYKYTLTPEAISGTRAKLDRTIAGMIPIDGDMRGAWGRAIEREINEGDYHAAQGLLLAAPAILPSSEANRLKTQLPPDARDDQIAAAALAFLPEDVQDRYATPVAANAFMVLGDLRDLTRDAQAWAQGQRTDEFTFILNGLGVALQGGDENARARDGASVIKVARRTGKLSPGFTEYLKRRSFAAVPPARLKQNLAEALSKAPVGGEEAAVAAAFQKSLDPIGYLRLTEDLGEIQAMAHAAGATVAAELLQHAQNGADLGKLHLVAQGGDRAWFVAKRAGAEILLNAARGTLQFTPPMLAVYGALALNLIALVFAACMTLAEAASHAWPKDLAEHDPAVLQA